MKILLVSSEVHPFSKTGGLADMVGALGKELAHAGHEVGIVTPLYAGILEKFPDIQKLDWQLSLPLGWRQVTGSVWTRQLAPKATVYFVAQNEFFSRTGLYSAGGKDFGDNAERFIFFSKAAANLARYLPWKPQVVHVHDWQSGLVPILLQHERLQQGIGNHIRTCCTVHNLAYQGIFSADHYGLTNLPLDYLNPHGLEFYGSMNCLKAGIAYADVITTVSPRYAREITTPEFGCGLDPLLRKRQSVLHGILNGVDYEEWNTSKNPYLNHSYSARNLSGKLKNKLELQAEFGLDVSAEIPLFGSVTRLAEQKGIDIEIAALTEMLSSRMQFVLLGSGSPAYEQACRELAARHPAQVAVKIGFDNALAHRIEAACDFYLMPSNFEPCGLNQMYSLRYGTIPIVRATGGLDDSVVDVAENPDLADGIKFSEYSSRALAKCIRKAMVLYQEPKLLRHYRRNAIQADFSWGRVVEQYEQVYASVPN